LTTFGPPVLDRRPGSYFAGTDGAAMPKMKTHKASKKRFRVTASGLLKRSQAGKKHLNSHKTGKRKRHLRESIVDGGKLSKKYIIMLGGKA
jgi:large subunit ribosomal protein L35